MVLVLIPKSKGGLTVAASLKDFAALSLEFEELHPLGVFDNFPKGDSTQLGSWMKGNIELQSSLEEPFFNCGVQSLVENSTNFFLNPSLQKRKKNRGIFP